MKKRTIFTGLLFLAILVALAVLLTLIRAQAQADVKQLSERIKHFEELTATLEKKLNEERDNQARHATFTPDGKAVITHDDKQTRIWNLQDGTTMPAPTQPAPVLNPPAAPIPPRWKPHEFNGMTYYIVPLTSH